MDRLRRLPSVSSFSSSLLRRSPSSSPDDQQQPPRALSVASSSLDEALSTAIYPSSVPQYSALSIANSTLTAALEQVQSIPRTAYSQRLELVDKILGVLKDEKGTRDTFRDHGGFLTAVSVLSSLDVQEGDQSEEGEEGGQVRYELVERVFEVLSVMVTGQEKNRVDLREKVGWDAVEEAIRLSGLMSDSHAGDHDQEKEEEDGPTPAERMLSIVYSFLTNSFDCPESSQPPFFTSIRHSLQGSSTPESSSEYYSSIDILLQSLTSSHTALNADSLPLFLSLQSTLSPSTNSSLRYAVLSTLLSLASSSTKSLVSLAEAGGVALILQKWKECSEGEEKGILKKLLEKLLEMGAGAKETRRLFQDVVRGWEEGDGQESLNVEVLEIILNSIKSSRQPSFFHFDIPPTSSSPDNSNPVPSPSISLRSLGRPFPPQTHGYTLLLWLQIHSPPLPSTPITLFTASDSTSKTHLSIRLNHLLQVEVFTQVGKPSVKFESKLELGVEKERAKWCHLAVVHQRPRFSSTSSLSLFVDGVMVETIRASYPVTSSEVSAFLGTPPLSSTLSASKSNEDSPPPLPPKDLDLLSPTTLSPLISKPKTVKWNLGPTQLIHGEVPEEMLFVIWKLRERYNSNFQDQLGQFLTNEASTGINIRIGSITTPVLTSSNATPNSTPTPSNSKQTPPSPSSPLVQAIRSRGSLIIPPHRILFSFSASSTLHPSSTTGLSSSGLSDSTKLLLSQTTSKFGSIVINSALSKLEDSLSTSGIEKGGFGVLEGGVVGVVPKSLDLSIWGIGGTPVLLRLMELAKDEKELELALKLFVEFVKESWRNSEDVEKAQGYEVLGWILRTKGKFAVMGLGGLKAVLELVGVGEGKEEEGKVENSLAARFVLLDLAGWSQGREEVKKELWRGLKGLTEGGFGEFNTRRLSKMHIARKLLFALRVNYFDHLLLEDIVEVLMTIVKAHFTTETVRHLATFLTATLCQNQQPFLLLDAPPSLDPSTSFILDASLLARGPLAPSLLLLESLHDHLLSPTSLSALSKFSRTITTKWSLLLLLDKSVHPYASILALRILVRLLQTQGQGFVAKFASAEGWSILRSAIPRLWNFGQIQMALFCLLHGKPIEEVGLEEPFGSAGFGKEGMEVSPVGTEVMRVILAGVGRGLKDLANKEKVPAVVVSRPGDGVDGDEGEKEEGLSLLAGFNLLLDLVTQTDRSVGPSHQLLTAPTPLADLALALAHYIPPLPAIEYPKTATLSPLPVLSARNGFDPPAPPPLPTIPNHHAKSHSLSKSTLKLNIPFAASFANGEAVTSPVSAMEERPSFGSVGESAEVVHEDQSISPAAGSLLEMLSGLTTHPITSLHHQGHKRSESLLSNGSGTRENGNLTGDHSLEVFWNVVTAAASGNTGQQVAFRTALVTDICRRLGRATPAMADHITSFVGVAVDLSLQGWIQDVHGLLKFGLSYTEKLLLDDGLTQSRAVPLGRLFKSLNLLVLLSLSLPPSEMQTTFDLLVDNQLTIFASMNTDAAFLECFLYRVCTLLRESDSTRPNNAVDLFKLLILQRPAEVEALIIGPSQRHPSEARVVEKLLDAEDDESFASLLEDYHPRLDQLHLSWKHFMDLEGARARTSVEVEIKRLEGVVAAVKARKDSQRKKMRKQRAAIFEWSEGIHDVEQMRVIHTKQDLADLALFVEAEWSDLSQTILRECGVWETSAIERKWRLDFTEGHCRMRKKMQPEDTLFVKPSQLSLTTPNHDRSRTMGNTRQDSFSTTPRKMEFDTPIHSPVTSNHPDGLWGENYEKSPVKSPIDRPTVVEADPGDNFEEDKNRKVRRNLEPGDVIFAVFNISRIVGLDAVPGLLLLARKNIYIVDHFFQTASGELVDAWDSPPEERDEHLQTLAELAGRRSTNTSNLTNKVESSRRSRRWSWDDVTEVHERRYLFRNVALELFFRDGRSFLLIFSNDERPQAYSQIAKHSPAAAAFGSLYEAGSSLGVKMTDAVLGHQRTKLEKMTQRWVQREISNFEYLTFINTSAGRTYNDLTQYPVFPWVIADFTSETIDLSSPSAFRDLTKPMGAQGDERAKEFRDRYSQLEELEDGTPPFHYGTHYSSAMNTVGFLVRLQPFTESYLDLQGGDFDLPDRMFWSIPKAWASASTQSRSDVRELIPEFYFLPEFLANTNKLNLGIRQDGHEIDNVELPRWANNDPRLFVQIHREALESDYVSANLCHWIDLIFGYKQTGDAARDNLNVFHSLSYEGAIDLDRIEDSDERRAAVSTIHNFGQTPRQLFTKPHAQRPARLVPKTHPLFCSDLPIERQVVTLIQSIVPVAKIGKQVAQIHPATPDRVLASPIQSLLLPNDPQHSLSFGYSDQTVQLHARGNSLPISLFESPHSELVSCAVFADLSGQLLVTGSIDSSVSLWKWRWRSHGKEGHLQQLKTLRGHSGPVRCVAASRAFSVFVSGSEDQTAAVWDLNRHRFVHRLQGHEAPVQAIAISDTTGDIVTCSGAILRVWTVNGVLIASRSTSNSLDPILAVAFSLSETRPFIATAHQGGRVSLWRCVSTLDKKSGWRIDLAHTLQHKNRLALHSQPDITSLAFTSRTLYTGDALGQVWLWNPPGTDLFLPDSTSGACMNCRSNFSLLESRRRCSSCAGLFCSLCTTTSIELGGRFCAWCFSSLSPLMATHQQPIA